MKYQKTVKKPAQLAGLRGCEFQTRTRRPVGSRQRADDLFCAGRQFGCPQIRFQAEFMQEFEFKGKNNLRRGFLAAKASEEFAHQFKNGGQGRFGFRGLLDERRGVGSLAQPANVLPKRTVCLAQTDFTERVQVGTEAAAE